MSGPERFVQKVETTFGDESKIAQLAHRVHGLLVLFGLAESYKEPEPITPGLE